MKAMELQKKAIEIGSKKCPDRSCIKQMEERLRKYELAARPEVRSGYESLAYGRGDRTMTVCFGRLLSIGPESYRSELTLLVSEIDGDPSAQKRRCLEAVIPIYSDDDKLIIRVTKCHTFQIYPFKSAGKLVSRAELRQDQKPCEQSPSPTNDPSSLPPFLNQINPRNSPL